MTSAVAHWTLDDVPWDRFDGSRVDPALLNVVKAAAMVEHNSGDYGTYLCNVFGDDPPFCAAAMEWAEEEVRHGAALARWAQLADPAFDFDARFRAFRDGFSLPLDVRESVRGTRSGELVARCVVESGTSSFYSAMAAATDEPVLKDIAQRIAGDEFRHYKLFYTHLKRYLQRERIGRWRRLWVALIRVLESEDDELAYAYHCANQDNGRRPYRRRLASRAYARRAYRLYRFGHLQRGLGMALKAAGLKPYGRVGLALGKAAWRFVNLRIRWLDRAAA